MKKAFLLTFIMAAAFALCVTGAWAYQFNPLTKVESYQGSSSTDWGGLWHLVIAGSGDHAFDIAGADLSGSTLQIHTGWPGSDASDLGAIAADLFLYSAGTSWAVRLYDGTAKEKGELFKNPKYDTSVDKFKGTGYIYGGAYDKENQAVPVWATTGLQSGKVTVTWKTGEVDVTLSDIPGFNTGDFSFLYASATCANSVLTGHAPLPPSVLLLGSGLAGLALLGRRKFRKG